MPKIRTPQRKVLPTGEVTDTRRLIPRNIFAAETRAQGQLASAVGQAAGILGQAAADVITLQGNEERRIGLNGYNTAFRDFQSSEAENPDYAKAGDRFDKFHKDITGNLLRATSHTGARRALQSEFTNFQATKGLAIDTQARTKLIGRARGAVDGQIDIMVDNQITAMQFDSKSKIIRTAVLEKAEAERKAYWDSLESTGTLSKEEVENAKAQYNERLGTQLLGNHVRATAAAEGWEEALKDLRDPAFVSRLMTDFGVDLKEINQIVKIVENQVTAERAAGKQELDTQREASRLEVTNELRPGGDLVASLLLSQRVQRRLRCAGYDGLSPLGSTGFRGAGIRPVRLRAAASGRARFLQEVSQMVEARADGA